MKDFKLWGVATIGTKGQVVIPAGAREHFRLREGDKLLMMSGDGKEALIVMKSELVEKYLFDIQDKITEITEHEDQNTNS